MGKVMFGVTAWWCLTYAHRKIYDTLAQTAQFESRATVPAIAMNIACGEVPQSNWMFATNPVCNGLNLTVSTILNQHAMSQYTA